MVADPKSLAIMIAKSPRKGASAEEPMMPMVEGEDEESSDNEALLAAADEVMAAIQAGDSAALMTALKAFTEMC